MIKDRRSNIIITSVILLVALLIGVLTSIKFVEFRNYEAQFVVREDVVDEIIKFSDYSPHIKGDVADSNIYKIVGTENTVAVVKKDSNIDSLDAMKNKTVSAVSGTSQFEVAANIFNTIDEVDANNIAFTKLKNGGTDVVVTAYKDAKAFVAENEGYEISNVEIEKVPSVLVMGGTHPNEPSGQLTATLFLENALVERGILYVITELNRSAYSYSQPQEATTWYYHLKTASGGTRTFKFGSRATNTVDQWPTPDVYTHSSGQQLSSSEVRNINRAYPGSENGTYTEQIAWAITNFVNQNDVTIVIDLHEASPEYLTINACVYHQDAENIINKSRSRFFRYKDENGDNERLSISFDQSPVSMHGLTHRELGDYTNAYVFLFETSNASQGKLRGAFTEDLITYYKKDKFYEAAVSYDEKNGTELIYGRPVSIDERVARHTLSIVSIINGFNQVKETRTVSVTGRDNVGVGGVSVGEFKLVDGSIPTYADIIKNGAGYYLLDVND